MGKPDAYIVDVEPINLDDARRESNRTQPMVAGPELLSIVRFGDGESQWVVVALSNDRRTASVAPLNQNGAFDMRHGVAVSSLWPYYGQDAVPRNESA